MKRVGLILFAVGVAALLVSPAVRADTIHHLDFVDANGGGINLFAANISGSSQLRIGSGGSVATISGIGSQVVPLSAGIMEFSITDLGGSPIDTSAVVGSLAGFNIVDFFAGSSMVARTVITTKPDSVSISVVPNPEPASLILLASTMAVGALFIRRKRVK